MTDTNKLTGQEAVIALMQGKKIKRITAAKETAVAFYQPTQRCFEVKFFSSDGLALGRDFFGIESIVTKENWEIVHEPMVWEGERTVGDIHGNLVVHLDFSWNSKRVKVRVEEIL